MIPMPDAAHHMAPAPLWVTVAALVLIACLWAAAAVAARRGPVRIVRRVPGIARREHGERPVAVWPPEEADHARR